MSAEFRELALAKSREAREQGLAGKEPENGVSQEFELLVVLRFLLAAAVCFGIDFVSVRAVGERLLRQSASTKTISQPVLKRRDLFAAHAHTNSLGWVIHPPASLHIT